jgi:dTDP-4-amino-4,6-dideoxygalactose transaminase
MDMIIQIAAKNNLVVIEDAAHAHGSEWKGKKAGSFGRFSSFSFQASKNMTAGEGGILCTNDQGLAAECDSLLWAGRKQGRPWYEFHRLGWNYRLTEFQAAILRIQLGRLDEQCCCREQNAWYLSAKLSQFEGITPLIQDERTTRHGYHIYMFRYNEETIGLPREKFIAASQAEGIPLMAGYTFPLYKSPMFLKKQFINGSFPLGTTYHDDIDYACFEKMCPIAERACSSEAVWIPQNVLLGTEQDMDDIVAAIKKILDNKSQL